MSVPWEPRFGRRLLDGYAIAEALDTPVGCAVTATAGSPFLRLDGPVGVQPGDLVLVGGVEHVVRAVDALPGAPAGCKIVAKHGHSAVTVFGVDLTATLAVGTVVAIGTTLHRVTAVTVPQPKKQKKAKAAAPAKAKSANTPGCFVHIEPPYTAADPAPTLAFAAAADGCAVELVEPYAGDDQHPAVLRAAVRQPRRPPLERIDGKGLDAPSRARVLAGSMDQSLCTSNVRPLSSLALLRSQPELTAVARD